MSFRKILPVRSSLLLWGHNDLYENWINHFTLCPVLTVPADDLDYVAHPVHLDLIASKVQEKLTGKEEVIFTREEAQRM